MKEQDSIRKRLVSDVSHEIRTPLNLLQNNLEAMIDGVLPISKERLSSLNDEVIRFSKLLDNLNTLKEFDAEEVTLKEENIFLDELIQGTCEEFSMVAKEKDIEVNYTIKPDEKYMVLGDPDKIKQVFINIISNAIKFTKVHGQIDIKITENKDQIVVIIKDNGIGIKKEDLPFIFERLYRGDKSRHEIQGSGIGLTIVKRILNLHGAEIQVVSEDGKGSIFTVTFNKK